MAVSVSESTDERASSMIRRSPSRTSARAIATRWRWPPESVMPRSPTSVSYPSGKRAMSSSTAARRAAAAIRSRDTSCSLPMAMFSATVAENRNGSCGT